MKAKVNKLTDIDSKNPFTVPESYFETLSDQVMSRLPDREVSHPIKVSIWTKAKPLVYMAAMFIGTYFIIQVMFKSTDGQQAMSVDSGVVESQYISSTDNYWSNVQVSEDEFYNYLEDQLVDDGYYEYMYNQVSF